MNLVPHKQLLLDVPFEWTEYEIKDFCVDNKVQETIGDVFCPTCRHKKYVHNSTNKTASFYDCKKCKACWHVFNIGFKDQKPSIMLFGDDGTQ